MKRILIVAATTGYQTRMFADAARRLGMEVVLATDRCHVLEDPWGDHAVPVRFDDPEAAVDKVVQAGPFAHPGYRGSASVSRRHRGEKLGLLTTLRRRWRLPATNFSPPAIPRRRIAVPQYFAWVSIAIPKWRLRSLRIMRAEAARSVGQPRRDSRRYSS